MRAIFDYRLRLIQHLNLKRNILLSLSYQVGRSLLNPFMNNIHIGVFLNKLFIAASFTGFSEHFNVLTVVRVVVVDYNLELQLLEVFEIYIHGFEFLARFNLVFEGKLGILRDISKLFIHFASIFTNYHIVFVVSELESFMHSNRNRNFGSY